MSLAIGGEMFEHYRDDLVAPFAPTDTMFADPRPQPPYRWDDAGCAYRETFQKDSASVAHGDIEWYLASNASSVGRRAHSQRREFLLLQLLLPVRRILLNRDSYASFGAEALSAVFMPIGRTRGGRFCPPRLSANFSRGRSRPRNFRWPTGVHGVLWVPGRVAGRREVAEANPTEWRFRRDKRVIAGCQYKNESFAQLRCDAKLLNRSSRPLYHPTPVQAMTSARHDVVTIMV